MNICSLSANVDALANLASDMHAGSLGLKVSVAVMREVLEAAQQQGEALVEMIERTPSLDGTGRIVDTRA